MYALAVSLSRSARTRYHKLGGFHNKNVFSHSFEGSSPPSRCVQDGVFLRAVKEGSDPGLPLWLEHGHLLSVVLCHLSLSIFVLIFSLLSPPAVLD